MDIEQLLKNHYKKVTADELEGLEKKVLAAVARQELKRTRVRSLFWVCLLVLSCFGFVISALNAYVQFGNSGAYDLASMAISDSSLVLAHSSDFFYSLAETIPVLPIATGFAAIATLLVALAHIASKDVRIIFSKLNYGTR